MAQNHDIQHKLIYPNDIPRAMINVDQTQSLNTSCSIQAMFPRCFYGGDQRWPNPESQHELLYSGCFRDVSTAVINVDFDAHLAR